MTYIPFRRRGTSSIDSKLIVLFAALWLVSLVMLTPSIVRSESHTEATIEALATDKDDIVPAIERELFTGQVVLLGEALKQRKLRVAEEMADQAVLETPDGDLIPLLADWRGRAFFQDERLRDRRVELIGYRRDHLPYLQVLMVFSFDDEGQRQYTDYWCDVCSIPMYEIKPCECCQGDIRLRFQSQGLPDYLHLDAGAKSSTGKSN